MILSDRFARALALAYDLHRTQERKGSGVPYLAHLLGVCSLVLEHGGGEDEACAALLHDAVEDQGGARTLARIESELGGAVAAIVAACTTRDTGDGWRANKEAYVAHLREASPPVKRVATADKLYNARATLADHARLGESRWTLFSAVATACSGTSRRWCRRSTAGPAPICTRSCARPWRRCFSRWSRRAGRARCWAPGSSSKAGSGSRPPCGT